jgi:hypothetical protein
MPAPARPLAAALVAWLGLAALLAALAPARAAGGAWGAGALLLLGGWALLLSLDERACGPLVLHEPLVAAGVGGLLIGRPVEGALTGACLQFIWPGLRPLGGLGQPAAGLAAVTTLGWLAWLPPTLAPWRFPLALGAGMLAAWWGRESESWLRRRNAAREAQTPRPVQEAGTLILAGCGETAARGLVLVTLLTGLPSVAFLLAGGAVESGGAPVSSLPAGLREGHGVLAAAACGVGAWLRDALAAWRAAAPPIPAPGAPAEAPGGEPPPLPPACRLALAARLLLLQAGFSARFLQRSGFLFLLPALPVADEAQGAGFRERLARDLLAGRAPNTHPLMAGALAGGLARLSLDVEAAASRPPGRLVEVGGAVLAQWGDRVLWGAVRPLLALVALCGLAAGPPWGWGVLLLGGLALELGGRWALIGWGARRGWALVQGLPPRLWQRLPRALARIQLPAVGLLAGGLLACAGAGGGHPLPWVAGAAWFILGLLAGPLARRHPLAWGAGCTLVSLAGAATSSLWGGGSG